MTVRVGYVRGALGAALWLSCALVACGDDEDDGDPAFMDAGGGTGGAGGTSGAGATGGAGGSGGTGGIQSMACDDALGADTSCGGADCPAIESPLAAQVCAITCCTEDDACGTRRAYEDNPTDCLAPAEPDPACPDFTMEGGAIPLPIDAGAGGMVFPGCCAPIGRCGIISTIDSSCITSSTLLPTLEPGDPCGDAADGGADDAGL